MTRTLALLTVLLLTATSAQSAEKPNIVVIFADDLGYGDLGCYGAKAPGVKTPNLDRLAQQGIRFTDWQSNNCVCGPSRASLLTGVYPPRNGYVTVSHGENPRQYRHLGLYQDQLTLAEVLKEHGYKTAVYGKWHMGMHPDYLPLRHGFDEYVGWPENFAVGEPKPIYKGDQKTGQGLRFEEVHDLLTEKSIDFFKRAKRDGNPFFLYLSHYLTHGPWEPSRRFATDAEWAARQRRKGGISQEVYPAMVRELDWHVGEVMKALKEQGLDDETLVFFTSDNGPWLTPHQAHSAGSAGPLRGSKFNTFEGGTRVPGIARYPGVIPEGQVSDDLVCTMDIFATVVDLLGARLPENHAVDGKSILPILSGQPGATSPHDVLLAYNGVNLQVVRTRRWKLHLPRTPDMVPFYSQRQWGRGTVDSIRAPLLFDLSNDIGEQKNVAAQHPELVKSLLEHAERARVELGDWGRVGTDSHDFNGFPQEDIHKRPVLKH